MTTLRLTMAEALVRHLAAQHSEIEGAVVPLFGGVFAIFGHGNVSGLGRALEENRAIATFRAHNEQAMAHAAIAFAKASNRRRIMACATSVGPGATNLVTAAATAHVNRLPILLLPADTFASRAPDPVLQQLEDFDDPWRTVNDCLRPVSRHFDRVISPRHLVATLPRAIATLLDPVEAGPVTLALPEDVQCECWDYPESFFQTTIHRFARVEPDARALEDAASLLCTSRKPMVIAGGGVHYAGACDALASFARSHRVPVAETQAGKSALAFDHRALLGAVGVTGTSAANTIARDADLVLAIGTRLTDFTTASRTLFRTPEAEIVGVNVSRHDARKHGARPLVCDAKRALELLDARLCDWHAPDDWWARALGEREQWDRDVDAAFAVRETVPPSDAEVIGAVNRAALEDSIVVASAGGLPGELHKLWRSRRVGTYHVEYGYSCMGYEIAGGLGVKMAHPAREVIVLVGDGSYLMMNSEIATSVVLARPLTIVVANNRGFGCIHRLAKKLGATSFENLLEQPKTDAPAIDFVAHARSLGAHAEGVANVAALEDAIVRARGMGRTTVLVIETDPERSTTAGGAWWEVPVPANGAADAQRRARTHFEAMKRQQGVRE